MKLLNRDQIAAHLKLNKWGDGNYALSVAPWMSAGFRWDKTAECYKPYFKLKSGKTQAVAWFEKEIGLTYGQMLLIANALNHEDELNIDDSAALTPPSESFEGLKFYVVENGLIGKVSTGAGDGTFCTYDLNKSKAASNYIKCRRCGQSIEDGALFTTGGSDICDDCF